MKLNDLTFQTINIYDSIEKTDLPGFIAAASKRAQRMRAGDFFFALLTFYGDVSPSDIRQKEWLAQLPGKYFNSRGSVTLAMQSVAEHLNKQILEFNRRAVSGRSPVQGVLNMGVIHQNLLYLLHSGETSTIILSGSGAEKFSPLPTNPRDLGISTKITYSLHQVPINKGDFVILCAQPPQGWEIDLLAQMNLKTHHQLRRRLVSPVSSQLTAAVIQMVSGKGEVQPIRFSTNAAGYSEPGVAVSSMPGVTPPQSSPGSPGTIDDLRKKIITPAIFTTFGLAGQSGKEDQQGDDFPSPGNIQSSSGDSGPGSIAKPGLTNGLEEKSTAPRSKDRKPISIKTGAEIIILSEKAKTTFDTLRNGIHGRYDKFASIFNGQSEKVQTPEFPPELKKKMATAWFFGRATAGKVEEGTKDVGKRLLPTREDFSGSVSPFTMLIIAIAVPIIIVVIASTVYIQRGHDELFALYSQQAQQYAEQALNSSDPAVQRNAWTQALNYVEKAENYHQTEVLDDIRSQAQSVLDSMESVARVSLKSATGQNFPGNVNITKIAANRTDLYLLDSNKGNVLRLFLTGQGYELDDSFICDPGPMGAVIIGPLVDMAILPVNNLLKATVMAIDSAGQLLYCIPGENPISTTLTPPDANWGQISGMDYQNDTLYLMDPPSNAVWYIYGPDLNFSDPPRLYFDESVPNMGDAIDFSINGDDLYLLHKDGKMIFCNYDSVATGNTRCTDPAEYTDNRDGEESQQLTFSDTIFSQIEATQMPDSSIYILDVMQPSIYHFSLRLNLQKIIMPMADRQTQLPENPVTSFTVTPNRLLFLAYGDEVFYAPLP